jgi:hypothetical protein
MIHDDKTFSSEGSLQELDTALLKVSERFSNYQRLPPFMENAVTAAGYAFEYAPDQLDLDAARFGFLDRGLKLDGLSVAEIGCNLGYFILRLASEYGCRATGFEPIEGFQTCIDRMAVIGEVESSIYVQPRGIGISDIATLSPVDLLIELNVLHHAGAVFDQVAVSELGGWEAYARARLTALALKGDYLLFQAGNSSGDDRLFPSESAGTFMHDMLSASGWEVVRVGSISDLTQLGYADTPGNRPENVMTYECHRNSDSGQVEYMRHGVLCGQLPTGLANRPIWLCRSLHSGAGDRLVRDLVRQP